MGVIVIRRTKRTGYFSSSHFRNYLRGRNIDATYLNNFGTESLKKKIIGEYHKENLVPRIKYKKSKTVVERLI